MKFVKEDRVVSTICKTMFGRVKRIVNDKVFIMLSSNKEILCHEDYYTKINKEEI